MASPDYAERGVARRTFVCNIPVSRRRVTNDTGESLQRRERLCAGRTLLHVREPKRPTAKGDLESVMRGQWFGTRRVSPTPIRYGPTL